MTAESSNGSNVWTSGRLGLMSRRRVLRGGAMLSAGLGAALMGCASAPPKPAAPGQAPPAAGTAGAAAPGRPGVPVVKGAPKDGGTWTLPIADTALQHDMHTALNQSIWHDLSERALQPDPWTNEVTANIVERWEVPDTTHFVLNVRKGVKLHNKPPWNAREFDAEDLAFNINRIAGNTAAAEGLQKSAFQRLDTLAGMTQVEVVDKYTVKVTMAQPSSTWLPGFLEWRNLMMPKGIVEVGFKDPMKFAGPGAYMLTEFVPGVREVFTKQPGYFRPGEPHFDKVVRTVVADTAASIAGFISRQFGSLSAGSVQDEKTVLAARPDALMYSTPGNQWLYLRPNSNVAPFTDFRVRKALQLAMNYQELGEGYYGPGWGYTGPVFSGFKDTWGEEKIKSLPGYNPATKAKDIADAGKLLAAAGRTNGEGMTFDLIGGPGTGIRIAQKENSLRFQDQMQKAFPGMKINIKILGDQAQWAAAQTAGNFPMMSFSSVSQPTATSEATSLYHSKGGRNYGKFANAEADVLLDKAAVTLDLKERTAIFETFQTKFMDEWMPMYALYVEPRKTLVQPNVGGYDKLVGPWNSGLSQHRQGALYYV